MPTFDRALSQHEVQAIDAHVLLRAPVRRLRDHALRLFYGNAGEPNQPVCIVGGVFAWIMRFMRVMTQVIKSAWLPWL